MPRIRRQQQNNRHQQWMLPLSKFQNVASMDWLLEHGADRNSADMNGTNALHYAAAGGQVMAMDWLIEHGDDVNDANSDGGTA
jgi:cytohesin